MKLWVVKISESEPPCWGFINEAVVRAETKDQAIELFFQPWGDLNPWNGDPYDWIEVAEVSADGPAEIISGTELA